MKPTRVLVDRKQYADAGLNPFAVVLLAESFADDPAKFEDNDILVCAQARNGQEVWMLLSKKRPDATDWLIARTVVGLAFSRLDPPSRVARKRNQRTAQAMGWIGVIDACRLHTVNESTPSRFSVTMLRDFPPTGSPQGDTTSVALVVRVAE